MSDQAEQGQEGQADERASREAQEAYKGRLEVLEDLVQSPGWEVFKKGILNWAREGHEKRMLDLGISDSEMRAHQGAVVFAEEIDNAVKIELQQLANIREAEKEEKEEGLEDG